MAGPHLTLCGPAIVPDSLGGDRGSPAEDGDGGAGEVLGDVGPRNFFSRKRFLPQNHLDFISYNDQRHMAITGGGVPGRTPSPLRTPPHPPPHPNPPPPPHQHQHPWVPAAPGTLFWPRWTGAQIFSPHFRISPHFPLCVVNGKAESWPQQNWGAVPDNEYVKHCRASP